MAWHGVLIKNIEYFKRENNENENENENENYSGKRRIKGKTMSQISFIVLLTTN